MRRVMPVHTPKEVHPGRLPFIHPPRETTRGAIYPGRLPGNIPRGRLPGTIPREVLLLPGYTSLCSLPGCHAVHAVSVINIVCTLVVLRCTVKAAWAPRAERACVCRRREKTLRRVVTFHRGEERRTLRRVPVLSSQRLDRARVTFSIIHSYTVRETLCSPSVIPSLLFINVAQKAVPACCPGQ